MNCQNAKMADKKVFILFLIYLNSIHNVNSASLFERSYEYVMNFGRNVGPSLMSILECFGDNGEDSWLCAREKAGKLLDSWGKEVEKQRMMWAEAADAEVVSSGRSFEELPSKIGNDIQLSLTALTDLVEHGMARALARKKHGDSGGIDSITISTSDGGKKKKMKKKKQKPAKIHLIQMPVTKTEEKGPKRVQSWVIGDLEQQSSRIRDYKEYRSHIEVTEKSISGVENHEHLNSHLDNENDGISRIRDHKGYRSRREVTEKSISGIVDGEHLINSHLWVKKEHKSDVEGFDGVNGDRGRTGRGILTQMWDMGEKALDAVAEHALENENAENGLVDRSSIAEQRGKKKKKKKAILKLLILGAVLKAKIGTLLQILSFKLQIQASHSTLFTGGRDVLAGTNYTMDDTGVRRRVKRLVIHPKFTVGPHWVDVEEFGIKQVGAHWDFLLAELWEPLPLDGKTMVAARLDDRAKIPPGEDVGYAGYGAAAHGDTMRVNMHAMDLEVLDDNECSSLIEFDKTDMICTKGRPPRFDSACNGDSGSGLIDRGAIIGVLSWAEDDATTCRPGAKVIFSRVAAVRDWIRQVTKL